MVPLDVVCGNYFDIQISLSYILIFAGPLEYFPLDRSSRFLRHVEATDKLSLPALYVHCQYDIPRANSSR